MTKVYLVGSDYVFPRTANKIINAYAAANGLEIVGEDYLPLGDVNVATIVSKVLDAEPDIVFNTLNGDSNVAFFKELKAKGNTPDQIQTVSVSVAEEEVGGIGLENIEGHLTAWNYYQLTDTPLNPDFVAAFKEEYGEDRVTADPIEAGYNAVYIWAASAEKACSFEVADIKEAAKGLELDTPEGPITVDESNQHISKTARIGQINADGLIDEIWASDGPIEPDPCLAEYDWAEGLAQGECDPLLVETFLEQVFNGVSQGSILLLDRARPDVHVRPDGRDQHGPRRADHDRRLHAVRVADGGGPLRGGHLHGVHAVAPGGVRRRRARRRPDGVVAAATDVRPAARHAARDVRLRVAAAASGEGLLRPAERERGGPVLARRQRRDPRRRHAVHPPVHHRAGDRHAGDRLARPGPHAAGPPDAGGHGEPRPRRGQRPRQPARRPA